MSGTGGMMLVWMVFWGAVAVALIGFAIVGIATTFRRRGGDPDRTSVESSEEVSRRRYAAGDIDEDEYERRRAGPRG